MISIRCVSFGIGACLGVRLDPHGCARYPVEMGATPDVESRATAYRIGNAHFPTMKTLTEFEFAGSPVNAATVRELQRGTFLGESCNVVLVGGMGSGKTHLTIAIGANCVSERQARVLVFNTVDLVTLLEAETRAGGRAGGQGGATGHAAGAHGPRDPGRVRLPPSSGSSANRPQM